MNGAGWLALLATAGIVTAYRIGKAVGVDKGIHLGHRKATHLYLPMIAQAVDAIDKAYFDGHRDGRMQAFEADYSIGDQS